MRAAVADRYGPPEVVRVTEVPDPGPRRDGVVVQVHAAAVTSGDARIRGARFPRGFGVPARLALGVRRPRRSVLGVVVSGTVVEVGDGVHDLAVGDEVCGMTGARMGGHAELVAVPAAKLSRKPAEVSHVDAAGVLFGATTALYFLRDRAPVARGARVLVNGAAGAIGTSAVQLAAAAGAEVVGVCRAANADLVTSLGAVATVDHTQVDVTTAGETYDVVLDAVGAISLGAGRRLLRPGGTLALAVGTLGDTVRARGQVVAGVSPERPADFDHLLGLVGSGDLRVVVRQEPLDGIVELHRLIDSGRKVGNVVVCP